ncbi:LOW QUALITY PROTEIN: EPHA10 isoform 9, partial [Pongo abelii]
QIRAASPGPSWEAQSFNPSIEVQTLGEAASGSRDQSPAVVITVVTISALLVLGSVMSVLAIWRRPCSYGKGGGDAHDEEELYFHFKVPTRRTFLDPQSCGDPLQAVHLFAKELDAKSVTLERSLGAGPSCLEALPPHQAHPPPRKSLACLIIRKRMAEGSVTLSWSSRAVWGAVLWLLAAPRSPGAACSRAHAEGQRLRLTEARLPGRGPHAGPV